MCVWGACCVLIKEGELESFGKTWESIHTYTYLLLRDYFRREIGADPFQEESGVMEIFGKESDMRTNSLFYNGLNTYYQHSSKYIKAKWKKESNSNHSRRLA